MDFSKNLHQLIEAVKQRNGKPINVNVVSATIESLGIRDIDAKNDYGYLSILELADYVFGILDQKEFIELKNKNQIDAEEKAYKNIAISGYILGRSGLFVKEYSTGIFHLLPVALQIISIIIFGFSLWTFVGFNNLQSTGVVLGVALGLIATGGLVQVIGKQVSFYWYHEDYKMALYSIKQLLVLGVKSLFFFFLFSIVVNFFIRIFPSLFVCIVFVYVFLIGLLLLSLAPLYTIKQRWMLTVSIFTGTCLSLFLHFYTTLPKYFTHWIGLIVSIIIPLLYLHFFFKKIINSKQGFSHAKPKLTTAIYRNLNYFIYGSLMFSFIFLDRILAWSSTLNRNLPYLIYYEKDYEIGMDLAILVFFMLAGVLEYSVTAFSRFMDYFQRTIRYKSFEEFNDKLLKMYYKNSRIFLTNAVVIGIILYLIMTKPWGYERSFDEVLSPLSVWVCVIGGFGYLFLTFGMLNVLYLYTVNQSKKPLFILLFSFIVNLIIGLVLSRLVSYEYAVVGMFIGSLAFMILTTRTTIKFFKNLDYYYYASY